MLEIPLIFAFSAGLVSFLSPCVLPLIPAFLAYLAGISLSESDGRRKDVFLASVFFVLGFASIFSLVGVLLNTILDRIAYDAQIWLSRTGGGIIIIFGLFLLGLIKIPFLQQEHRLGLNKKFKSKFLTAFIFGAAFAAGWTPCVGAVLGSILGLAATAPGSALTLLFVYSLGLGLPFLIVGLFASQSSMFIVKISPYLIYLNIVFGITVIVLGVLAFTQNLNLIANLEILNRWLLK